MVKPYYSTEGKRKKVDIGDINMLEWKGRSDFIEHIGKKYREYFVPHTKLKEMQKMELKNAKNEIANMVEKEDKDKKKN